MPESTTIYLIRHCSASGQEADAPLTAQGRAQAQALASFLAELKIERLISSPYARAVQSIAPLATLLGLPIETDPRLCERVLSRGSLPDWRERLQASFNDLDLCYEGGESSRVAMQRGVEVIERVQRETPGRVSALVSHGNLLALLLKHFDARLGFAEWQLLSNPDVYRVVLATPEPAQLQRLWRSV